MSTCEPCRTITECLQFPFVFYSINGGKTYTSPVLSYEIPCPDGSLRTVVLPAGTFVYTLPFPSDFIGPLPPIVFPCSAGGFIIKNITVGATQAEIDALVLEVFTECGRAVAAGEVTCGPSVVSNGQVVFDPNCAPGTTLTFSGTPPSWITIDSVNNLVLGAAGEFSSNNQTSADAAAQAVLNGWATQQIALGNLTCSSGPPCISAIADISPVLGGNSIAMIPSRDTATRRVVEDDSVTPQLVFINTATDTVVGTNPFNNVGNGGAFASSVQQFFFPDGTVPGCKVTDKDGVNAGSVTTPDVILGMMYSPVQDRIYSIYPDGGTFSDHLISINPNTLLVDNNVDTGGSFGAPQQFVFNLKEQIGMVVAPDLVLFSIPALAPAGTVSLAPGGWAGGACYAANVDKIFIGAFNGADTEIWQINPSTLLKEFAYTLAPSGINSIEYNPVSGTILSKQVNGDMTLIDPIGQAIVCVINTTTNNNAVVDVQSGKVYTEDDGATKVVVYA